MSGDGGNRSNIFRHILSLHSITPGGCSNQIPLLIEQSNGYPIDLQLRYITDLIPPDHLTNSPVPRKEFDVVVCIFQAQHGAEVPHVGKEMG